jgi:hypothetical protein
VFGEEQPEAGERDGLAHMQRPEDLETDRARQDREKSAGKSVNGFWGVEQEKKQKQLFVILFFIFF